MKNGLIIIGLICLIACNASETSSKFDLMKYGMPITIAAPADAEVVSEDLGFMKDITVKHGDDYFIQILSGAAIELDPTRILADKKNEVVKGPFFSKMIHEEDNGFIFEKKIDDQNINYDFRYVRIQGDKEYTFQTGLIGRFSEAAVRKMFESVK